MKKSKCEKAAERYTLNQFKAFSHASETLEPDEKASMEADFKAGAEALLRYAKRQKVCYSASNPKNMRAPMVISIDVLEQWVKGEE